MRYGQDGSLWYQFSDLNNFIEAERRAALKKTSRKEVVDFRKDFDKNILEVFHNTIEGKFTPSPYKEKVIYEPKERIIYIVPYNPDRIVQHAVMNPLEPYFKRLFIEQTYSCVPGRGQIQASQYTMKALRHNNYCLKCDIHHFYPSVDHQVLSNMLHSKFADDRLMAILDTIIFSFPGEKNLPIGNYVSQWLGNFYLTPLDNFIKRVLRFHWYERYCDDFLMFSNDKTELTEAKEKIDEFIHKELKLEYSYAEVFKITDIQCVDFVGYRHFKNKILVRKSTAQRQKKHLKYLESDYLKGKIDENHFRAVLDSYLGIYMHAQTHNLRVATDIEHIRRRHFGLPKGHRKHSRLYTDEPFPDLTGVCPEYILDVV